MLGLLFYNIIYSMKSISNIGKKRGRGRPATDATPVLVRLQPDRLAAIDAWIAKQDVPMTRPEAIRAMLDAVLVIAANPAEKKSRKPGRASRAAELAAKAIDRIIDPSAPPEELNRRRRRLTKGPSEFRDDRVDLPKATK